MSTAPRPRILCVDDEPNVLSGLQRQLGWDYEVTTAGDGPEGLARLDDAGPFAVVISDMRMPGMDGARLLAQARERHPDVVRLLLTGHADIEAAVRAINDGGIFRFLLKPCPTPSLLRAAADAVRQHELIRSEKVLLAETLAGAVAALTEALSFASPEVFGRATRVRHRVADILEAAGESGAWAVGIAAMMAHLPVLTVPPETLERHQRGIHLEPDERLMIERVPALGDELLASIPRLGAVRKIIRYQQKNYDGSGPPVDRVGGRDIPLGARVLRLADDYEVLEGRGFGHREAMEVLRQREGAYDPALLDALDRAADPLAAGELVELRASEVRVGVVITEDVLTRTGVVVLARGQVVTDRLLERLHNFARNMGVEEPIRGRFAPPRAE